MMRSRLWEAFSEHRLALASAIALAFFALLACAAPLVTRALGVSHVEQDILNRYAPAGSRGATPASTQEAALEKKIADEPDWAEALATQIRAAGLSTEERADDAVFSVWEKFGDEETRAAFENIGTPEAKALVAFKERFTTTHWLGTDELGRDVLARLAYGARVSLFVAFFTGLSAAFIGLLIGSIAGYYGGFIDAVLMRLTDALLALPITPLLILLAAVDLKRVPVLGDLFGMFGPENESIAKMMIILAAFAWMPMARLVRSSVLSIRESEFVLAARTVGASDARIVLFHLLPNILGPLLVAVTLATGENMLIESALSFLGLGIQPPAPSWGNMLQNAMELVNTFPLLAFLPGLLIFMVVIAVNFLGDGLRDALDPKALKR